MAVIGPSSVREWTAAKQVVSYAAGVQRLQLSIAKRECEETMVKNKGSRVFHFSMVVPLALLCLLAVISFGSFTSVHLKIRSNRLRTHSMTPVPRNGISPAPGKPHYCILFTEYEGKNSVVLSESPTCSFVIWGGISVFILSLVLGIVFTAKALYGVNV